MESSLEAERIDQSDTDNRPRPAGQGDELIAGRYHLERHLATGGMSEVWLATDTGSDGRVALLY